MDSLWWLVLQAVYFFLPAYVANMMPEIFKFIPVLGYPVWEKEFGHHKTWRGIVLAVLGGFLIFLLQKWLYRFSFFYKLSIIDYSDFTCLLGVLMGLGAILGDLIKSYFKRGMNLKPGESWMPWDQLDFVIGGLVLGMLVYVPKIGYVLALLIVSPFLHIGVSRLGYWLGIKRSKF